MPKTVEVDAKKRERERRERRHYYPEHLGRECADPTCTLKLPRALEAAGFAEHPACGAEARQLRAARAHA